MRRVSVLLAGEMTNKLLLKEDIAIVIDVFRASTTIISALLNGAEAVIPSSSIRVAKNLKKDTKNSLLAGERWGRKIRGFDLDNSPLEIKSLNVRGKKIILTTTHGTRLLKNAMKKTNNVLVGALQNRRACSQLARELSQKDNANVKILIPQSMIGLCIEDLYAAGLIVQSFQSFGIEYEGDLAEIASLLAALNRIKMVKILLNSSSAVIVRGQGHGDDIEYCLQIDVCNLVPTVVEGEVKPVVVSSSKSS
jgi:2-phosphosulfolactate phosphatase